MMQHLVRFGWLLGLALMLLAFGVSAQEETADPAALPLLQDEWNLGTTFFGSGAVPEDAALDAAMTEAAAEGMNAFTFYVDWPELEPEPGEYDLESLADTLAWLHGLGIQPLLNITILDIDEVSLPHDLANEEGTDLREGLSLDDPLIIQRLNALLDEVVPLLLENGGFLLLLGNEGDSYMTDIPDADPAAYARLIEAARAHVRSIEPALTVGVTLTGTEVLQQGEVFQALRPVTDIIAFNYYGWSLETFQNLPLDAIPPFIETYLEIYDGDPIVITELGCPSAENNNSSPEYQAQCLDVMLSLLRQQPNVRYVTIFTLYDWDEETCDLVNEYFSLEELPEVYQERWRGYLCTLGMLNADYTPKPAWDVFRAYLPDA